MKELDKEYRKLCIELGKAEIRRAELKQSRLYLKEEVEVAKIAELAYPEESKEAYDEAAVNLGNIAIDLANLTQFELDIHKKVQAMEIDNEK